jgi:hypothetical protein
MYFVSMVSHSILCVDSCVRESGKYTKNSERMYHVLTVRTVCLLLSPAADGSNCPFPKTTTTITGPIKNT